MLLVIKFGKTGAYLDGSGLPTSVQAWNFLPLWMNGKTHLEGNTSPASVMHWSVREAHLRVLLKSPSSKAPSTRAAEAVHSRLIPLEDSTMNWCRPANLRVPSDEVPPKEEVFWYMNDEVNFYSLVQPFSLMSFKTTP